MYRSLRRRDTKDNQDKRKTDYSKYQFGLKEGIVFSMEGIMILTIFSYFFYRSILAFLLLLPLLIPILKRKKRFLCEKRKYELNLQFKEALNSIQASVLAGYSLENAFFEAYRDMVLLYGSESMIATELFQFKKGIKNNRTIEEILFDFGKRSGLEDIRNFADILIIGKKSGGNINELIQNSVTVIEDKVSVLQEIQTMISARKFEQKIMNGIPFFIIFYVELTSRGFFSVLYHNAAGVCLMTVCFGLYLTSVLLSDRMTDISV